MKKIDAHLGENTYANLGEYTYIRPDWHLFLFCTDSSIIVTESKLQGIFTLRLSPGSLQTPRYFFWFPLSSAVTKSSVRNPVTIINQLIKELSEDNGAGLMGACL